jgi:BA14K-like protein
MSTKRVARCLGLTALVSLAAGMVALPSVSQAENWRVNSGVGARSWHPGPVPYDPYLRNDAASVAAGAAAGIAAGSIMGNVLSQPQQQPTSPPSSVYIAPPKPPAADPAMPTVSYPIRAGVPPQQPGYPDQHTYCASMYPSYDPMTGTYLDEYGQRQYCQ